MIIPCLASGSAAGIEAELSAHSACYFPLPEDELDSLVSVPDPLDVEALSFAPVFEPDAVLSPEDESCPDEAVEPEPDEDEDEPEDEEPLCPWPVSVWL